MKIGAPKAKGQAKAATGKAAPAKTATPKSAAVKGVAKAPAVRAARAAKAAPAMAEAGEVTSSLREQVYEDLRYRLITGKIAPGVGISTRGLAQQLGVSQMPVRDALSRIAAEGAVDGEAAKHAKSTPTLAQAQPPATTQPQPVVDSQPTQPVASPAPAPKPVKQLSRPKHSSPDGASFDDSG